MNVLIIDDSDVALAMMTRVLSGHGHRVVTLPSSIGATRTVLRESIDVVVIDVNLPSIRGDKLAGLFRANDRMAKVGVVLVSGMDRAELERLAREAGVDGAVPKDALERELHRAVVSARSARAG